MRLQVTLGTDFTKPNEQTLIDEKNEGKKSNPGWRKGDPYGAQVLKVGRDAGNLIINSLKIDRINLRINIDKILSEFYIPN